MKLVKLGIIGCGVAARDLHWPALQQMPEKFMVTAVCNHTEPKAKDFANMVGNVPYVLDYHDLLAREDVEAVSIVLPYHLNYPATKHSLEAGKHVLVEKPLAAELSDAKKMTGLQDKYPLVTMVAENFRYRPIFQKVKAYIQGGEIGYPYSAIWNVLMQVERKYAAVQWRRNNRYPRGLAIDGGVHYVAALRFLFGDITAGIASGDNVDPELGGMDTFSFQFTTQNKISGAVNIYYSVKGHDEDRLLIFGTEGTILVEPYRIVIKKESKDEAVDEFEVDIGYRGEYEDFSRAITTGQKPVATFAESYQDLKTMLLAVESVERGRRFQD